MVKSAKSPPKVNPQNKNVEELLKETIHKLNVLTDKVTDLETSLKAAAAENTSLKATVAKQDDEIASLKDALNSREQHARSWSVRLLNIQLPPGQESNNKVVMDTVYNNVLLPILEGAKQQKEISIIPECENLLDTAHILPGKGTNKPIIARFFSRYWRSIIFRFRKDFAPREDGPSAPATRSSAGAGAAAARAPRMKYSIFEDLTGLNFKQLQSIKQHEAVTSAWSVNGIIKFKVKNSEQIYKVVSLYDTVDSIIE
jgi:hypothetical protein